MVFEAHQNIDSHKTDGSLGNRRQYLGKLEGICISSFSHCYKEVSETG